MIVIIKVINIISFRMFLNVYFFSVPTDEDISTQDEIASNQRKQKVDNQMKTMIREILLYCIFLFMLLLVANRQQDSQSYQQSYNLIQTLTSPLSNQVE